MSIEHFTQYPEKNELLWHFQNFFSYNEGAALLLIPPSPFHAWSLRNQQKVAAHVKNEELALRGLVLCSATPTCAVCMFIVSVGRRSFRSGCRKNSGRCGWQRLRRKCYSSCDLFCLDPVAAAQRQSTSC